MKLVYFKELSQVLPLAEGREHVASKVIMRLSDTELNELSFGVRIGGRSIGKVTREGIPLEMIPEGVSTLQIEMEGRLYSAGLIERKGRDLSVSCQEAYSTMIRAAMLAEQALRMAKSFEKRVKALEVAANGVDLMNLT